MVTIRQLEALYWITQLGSFSRAAQRLNASQSAISKRIQELEIDCKFKVLERAGRDVRITARGGQLLEIANEILLLSQQIAELSDQPIGVERHLRIGVNEFTAITWLPKLIHALEQDNKAIIHNVEVEGVYALTDRLEKGHLDLIIRSQFEHGPIIRTREIASVPLSWVASPSLCDKGRLYSQSEIDSLPVVTYGLQAGVRDHVQPWATLRKPHRRRVITTDSFGAIVSMVLDGLGAAVLPTSFCGSLIASRQLVDIKTDAKLPDLPFVVAYRVKDEDDFMLGAVNNIIAACDFTNYPTTL